MSEHFNLTLRLQVHVETDKTADPDLDGASDDEDDQYGSSHAMLSIESKATSLVVQGLLNGFLSHRQLKFAITGAKKSTALVAGFPNVYQTIISRYNESVPGWVKERKPLGGAFGPGKVVNLSGKQAEYQLGTTMHGLLARGADERLQGLRVLQELLDDCEKFSIRKGL